MRRHIHSAFAFLAGLAMSASTMSARVDLRKAAAEDAAWFASDAGRAVISSVLSHQTTIGGWGKGYDNEKPMLDENVGAWEGKSTFDNGATIHEMRFLIAAERATGRADVRAAIVRGVDFILAAELPNGGWPQRFPLPDNYGRHATFNDNAITNILNLAMDITAEPGSFSYIDEPRVSRLKTSVDRGISFILRSQVRVDGRLTGWCQQHDAQTFEPVPARSFELVSLSGSEGAAIVMLLMRIENPSPQVVDAINAAVAWTDVVAIRGKRVATIDDPTTAGKKRRVLVDDPDAPTLWSRFYEIGTNKPFFCNRDGIKLYAYEQLDQERSMGYSWLGTWGQKVLDEYPKWQRRVGAVDRE
jgi:PelA/Pel-15E family pectate lyase